MLSIDELVTGITEEQALEKFLTILETLKVPARSWRKGGVYRNILRTVARSFSGFTEVMADFARSGFLDTASGPWLTLLAYYVYGVKRRPATFASGKALFTNHGGAVYDPSNGGRAGAVRLLWVSGNKAYVTTEDLYLNGVGATALVAIQAVELGSASSVGPGLIDTLETTLLGVTVTNPLSVVGSNEQDDESLRDLCRAKIAALSLLGPRGAYEFAVGVATRLDGSPVDINRVKPTQGINTGIETVYVASPAGPPLESDLDLVREAIERWARPDSVTAVVVAATPVAFSKALTVFAKHGPGVDAPSIAAAANAALVKLVSAYDIGGIAKPMTTQGYLFASNIEGTVKSAHDAIFAVDGVGADLPLNDGEVATLAATLTVRLV